MLKNCKNVLFVRRNSITQKMSWNDHLESRSKENEYIQSRSKVEDDEFHLNYEVVAAIVIPIFLIQFIIIVILCVKLFRNPNSESKEAQENPEIAKTRQKLEAVPKSIRSHQESVSKKSETANKNDHKTDSKVSFKEEPSPKSHHSKSNKEIKTAPTSGNVTEPEVVDGNQKTEDNKTISMKIETFRARPKLNLKPKNATFSPEPSQTITDPNVEDKSTIKMEEEVVKRRANKMAKRKMSFSSIGTEASRRDSNETVEKFVDEPKSEEINAPPEDDSIGDNESPIDENSNKPESGGSNEPETAKRRDKLDAKPNEDGPKEKGGCGNFLSSCLGSKDKPKEEESKDVYNKEESNKDNEADSGVVKDGGDKLESPEDGKQVDGNTESVQMEASPETEKLSKSSSVKDEKGGDEKPEDTLKVDESSNQTESDAENLNNSESKSESGTRKALPEKDPDSESVELKSTKSRPLEKIQDSKTKITSEMPAKILDEINKNPPDNDLENTHNEKTQDLDNSNNQETANTDHKPTSANSDSSSEKTFIKSPEFDESDNKPDSPDEIENKSNQSLPKQEKTDQKDSKIKSPEKTDSTETIPSTEETARHRPGLNKAPPKRPKSASSNTTNNSQTSNELLTEEQPKPFSSKSLESGDSENLPQTTPESAPEKMKRRHHLKARPKPKSADKASEKSKSMSSAFSSDTSGSGASTEESLLKPLSEEDMEKRAKSPNAITGIGFARTLKGNRPVIVIKRGNNEITTEEGQKVKVARESMVRANEKEDEKRREEEERKFNKVNG